jgi:hypothetical protein
MHVPDFAQLCAAAAREGLACRGGFEPDPSDGVPPLADGREARTLVLLGFTGSLQWGKFASSPEFRDGAPDPLDRWSTRVAHALADNWSATALSPASGPPWWPFQRWALRAEPLHRSPLGILLHPVYGSWHAYRAALLFAEPIVIPRASSWPHPCESCVERPCLRRCPVDAVARQGFDVARCRGHLARVEGSSCMESGCGARAACPLGAEHRYGLEQAAFHMRALRPRPAQETPA